MKIRIVEDHYGACPRCGAYWGHPDPALDFPNRCKVDHYWRCYNTNCSAAFYDPEANEVVEDELTPEQAVEQARRIKRQVEEMMRGKQWVERKLANGLSCWELAPETEVTR